MAIFHAITSLISSLLAKGYLILFLMLTPQPLSFSVYGIEKSITPPLPKIEGERVVYTHAKSRVKKPLRSLLVYLDLIKH